MNQIKSYEQNRIQELAKIIAERINGKESKHDLILNCPHCFGTGKTYNSGNTQLCVDCRGSGQTIFAAIRTPQDLIYGILVEAFKYQEQNSEVQP